MKVKKGNVKMNILSLLTPKEETFYVNTTATLRQVLEKFDYYKFTVIPLLDTEGRYLKTISEGDILRFIKNHCGFDIQMAENTLVEHIEVYRPYEALDINCSLKEIIMLSMRQNFVPLIDDRGVFIGMIKRKDIISYFYKKYPPKNDFLDDK